MEYTDKEYCLEVWGDYACFTRPELKVERVSYDVITPSAARAIFEAILFKKYAMRWQVTKIEVLNPIKWDSVRRNEVGATANVKSTGIYIEDKRQHENPMKYYQMFERRAKQGQCFTQPYLGTREFSASFRLVNPETEELAPALSAEQGGNRDLGIMLYDMDFSDPKDIQALFYRAEMKEGVIIVPPLNSEEILR